MEAAVRDDNPVVYLEHKLMLGVQGDVPEGEYIVPIGKADIKRSGKDVSLIAWSAMVPKSLAAAEMLAAEGIDAEVVDLRTLTPLDRETLLGSVERTGRAVVVHEAVKTGGFGGEVAAVIADEGFNFLDAPVKRVAAPDTPIPFSPVLEKLWIPDEARIVAAAKELVRG